MKRWLDHLEGQIYVSAGLPGDCLALKNESPIFCLGRGISKARTRGRKAVSHLLVCRLLLTYYDQ